MRHKAPVVMIGGTGHYVSQAVKDEIERLRKVDDDNRREFAMALAIADKYISKLENALESIANNTCCEGCQEAARVAKAALEDD